MTTFHITLKNGESFDRTEWGKRKAALKTLQGIYGENIAKVVFIA